MTRRIAMAALAAALVAPFASSASRADTTVLFNVFTPLASPTFTKVLGPWHQEIEKVTQGRVKINRPPQSLAPPPEQLNMVRAGVADGAFMFNAFLQKSHPLLQLAFLPGTMTSGKADAVALWRTYQNFFKDKNAYDGVVLLGFFASPPGHIYNIDKTPIQSLDFFKGKKVWSLPGVTAQAMGRTGATVVPGPAVRMYEIISKGVVDAFCCIEYGDLNAFKVLQYVGAVTEVEGAVFSPKFSVFMSNAKWQQISPADQAAIMKISGEALARLSSGIDDLNAELKKKYLAGGGTVVTATPAFNAALKKAWQPLHDDWMTQAKKLGVDGEAALAFYLAEAKKVAMEK
jgi:TRAP-type C4-dicarboxylate transport system substrate-binding protein